MLKPILFVKLTEKYGHIVNIPEVYSAIKRRCDLNKSANLSLLNQLREGRKYNIPNDYIVLGSLENNIDMELNDHFEITIRLLKYGNYKAIISDVNTLIVPVTTNIFDRALCYRMIIDNNL